MTPSPVEFGIFDQISRPPGAFLGELYEEEIARLKKADEAGFYCYHLSEHHGHNLCTAPSQLVFLAALARETKSLRLGTLVSCLPYHHPLRLVEEICMVDQLSGGRLDIGVGRGVSVFEHNFFGHDYAEARDRYRDTLEMVIQGLVTGRIDSNNSPFHDFPEVEVSLEPLQKPYPPLWFPGSVEYAGRLGFNWISGRITRELRQSYEEAWHEGRDDPNRLNPHVANPKVGSYHALFIADTDAEARAIAERANAYHGGLTRRSDGTLPPHLQGEFVRGPWAPAKNVLYPGQEGHGLVYGSPETVRQYFREYVSEGNVNYIIVRPNFGDTTAEEANRTLEYFITEVMPAVQAQNKAA